MPTLGVSFQLPDRRVRMRDSTEVDVLLIVMLGWLGLALVLALLLGPLLRKSHRDPRVPAPKGSRVMPSRAIAPRAGVR